MLLLLEDQMESIRAVISGKTENNKEHHIWGMIQVVQPPPRI